MIGVHHPAGQREGGVHTGRGALGAERVAMLVSCLPFSAVNGALGSIAATTGTSTV